MIGKIAIGFIVLACVSSAQVTQSKPSAIKVIWSPPRIGWQDNPPSPTVPKEMIGTLRIDNMPINLEETKLEDARKHFGGTIGSRGDAGDAEAWLCLHGSDVNGPWIFWLTSGEIDGPSIGGFQWRRLSSSEKPDRRCRSLPNEGGGIRLPLAIHPGMTKLEVQQILGMPTYVRNNTQFFSHEHQRIIGKETWTVSNDMALVFRYGVVWAMEVAKTTSD